MFLDRSFQLRRSPSCDAPPAGGYAPESPLSWKRDIGGDERKFQLVETRRRFPCVRDRVVELSSARNAFWNAGFQAIEETAASLNGLFLGVGPNRGLDHENSFLV